MVIVKAKLNEILCNVTGNNVFGHFSYLDIYMKNRQAEFRLLYLLGLEETIEILYAESVHFSQIQ